MADTRDLEDWLRNGTLEERSLALEMLASGGGSVPLRLVRCLCRAVVDLDLEPTDRLSAALCLSRLDLQSISTAFEALWLVPLLQARALLGEWAQGEAVQRVDLLLDAVPALSAADLEDAVDGLSRTTALALVEADWSCYLDGVTSEQARQPGKMLQQLLSVDRLEGLREAIARDLQEGLAGNPGEDKLRRIVEAFTWMPPSSQTVEGLVTVVAEYPDSSSARRAVEGLAEAGSWISPHISRLIGLAVWDDFPHDLADSLVTVVLQNGADARREARNALRNLSPDGQVNNAAWDRVQRGG